MEFCIAADTFGAWRRRPRHEARRIFDGIFWVLKTGARWKDLPLEYPSYQTCHRPFQEWRRSGIMRDVLEDLVRHLQAKVKIDLTETFIDASFVEAKKGIKNRSDQVRGKASSITLHRVTLDAKPNSHSCGRRCFYPHIVTALAKGIMNCGDSLGRYDAISRISVSRIPAAAGRKASSVEIGDIWTLRCCLVD